MDDELERRLRGRIAELESTLRRIAEEPCTACADHGPRCEAGDLAAEVLANGEPYDAGEPPRRPKVQLKLE